jgi:hypothetical protein
VIDLDAERADAFAMACRQDTEALARWAVGMNESGLRRQAEEILSEIAAAGMASVVEHLVTRRR